MRTTRTAPADAASIANRRSICASAKRCAYSGSSAAKRRDLPAAGPIDDQLLESRVARDVDGEEAAREAARARPRQVEVLRDAAVEEPLGPGAGAPEREQRIVVPVEDPDRQRVSSETLSTCGVCGNMSTGRHLPERVAVLAEQHLEVARERRRVARDVDDAAARSISPERVSAPCPASPARGGSTTTTSGSPARARSSSSDWPTFPAKNAALRDPVQLGVLDRAGDRLLARSRPPTPSSACAAIARPDRAGAAVQVVDGLRAGQPGASIASP